MSEHDFQLRMKCIYSGDDNTVLSRSVEHLHENQWKPFELGIGSPGFEIFVYSLLECQHTYMRTNCAERGLVLDTSECDAIIGANKDWALDTLNMRFSIILDSGSASTENTDYIVSRMKQCPVSRNLREIRDSEIHLDFEGQAS